ncbi:MAG: valine--tRNA ligase [Firmicutes bacterium]|nr:valine--tRNA ligase [Bacillota bacterium]
MEKTYQFKAIEQGLYEHWKTRGFFNSGDHSKQPFCVVIPPPNVTGKLHLGHAWDQTLQDIIVRRKRMQGYDTLYLPGMDHAGIATQAKVDERLKLEGTNRYELGRDTFLEKAWAWKEEYASIIRKQWQAIGISVDYNKERFTLDQKLNDAVNHVFLSLYQKGYIYRDYRIISWDPQAKTALSNIEVDYQETQSKLYYFNYPFVSGSGHMTIATTRPETMFADQALMVHPEDARFKDKIGQFVYIPNTTIQIPIIADTYVDMTFGTGVVKVTPAHDPNDFEVGKRHQLAMPLCMEDDGKMNALSGKYEELDRFECRKQLIVDLEALSLVEKIEDYTNNVGYSERTGIMVEPRLSLQWFVDMKKLSEEALKTEVNFVPSRFKKIFDHWMTEPYDWCISRQLWWGHRIPAWYKEHDVKVQIESPGEGWVQDEDVLDTWFSSALWPFSTLGWPEQTEDFNRYYPTDVLVTGYDIIFFWVARMIFQGIEFTQKDPFKNVLIHGLIRDKDGRKMSKSLGNGVDPMDVIDTYGIDALRYFLTTNSAPGLDMRYDETKVESSWNFLNKFWNVTRFVDMSTEYVKKYKDLKFSVMDQGILAKLSQVIKSANFYYDKYEFGEVAKVLYHFIWDVYANTYIEYAKVELKNEHRKETVSYVLRYVLETVLKLMHPFVPFVTDRMYEILTGKDDLMVASWPQADDVDESVVLHFDAIDTFITKFRNQRAETQVFKPLDIIITSNNELLETLKASEAYLMASLKASSITFTESLTFTDDYILIPSTSIIGYVSRKDMIDEEKERELLTQQKEKLEAELKRSQALLSNDNFLSKASPEKIQTEKDKQASYQIQYDAIISKLK